MWYLYCVRCRDGSIYTGVTTDVERRLKEHNGSVRGAKYTRRKRPVKLQAVWPYPDRSSAQKAEARFKRLDRMEKLFFIADPKLWAGVGNEDT